MKTNEKVEIGSVNISMNAIADLTGITAASVYGVVGLVNKKNFANPFSQFLKTEDFSDGVSDKKSKKGYDVSLYLVLSKDIKIIEVVFEIQKQVRYVLTKQFSIPFEIINVFVQGVK
ncbi:MAG: Asp23/Gls24 family envelope stress response protein [Bacilli bacterium]